MKVYISADIEGVTGIAHWDEANHREAAYAQFRQQMTREVAAACEGALAAGATQLWVKDAHETGRNLLAEQLPEQVRLIRGWSGHPLSMVQELDESFDAVMMVGYHSRAGLGGNPLAHTMSASRIAIIEVNGTPMSEFHWHALAASSLGVPVVLVSGDKGLCDEVEALNPAIQTVAVMEGIGDSTISIHPNVAVRRIRQAAQLALEDPGRCLVPLPEHFEARVRFVKHQHAYRASHYPGAVAEDPHTIAFHADQALDVLRMLLFCLP